MINECIILAGGLGTRLRSVVADLPKCMAPVNGKPFLAYVINYFKEQGIQKFIFSVGYKSDAITSFLAQNLSKSEYLISPEDEPLGTGGAIKLACSKVSAQNTLVLNGDTLFSIAVNELTAKHITTGADCTLSLKPMHDFDRYGVVELNADDSIRSFKEKQYYAAGLINGGAYALAIVPFLKMDLPDKFSFEKDYLEKMVDVPGDKKSKMYGSIHDSYFIDIGIPADYERAQKELAR